MATGLGASEGTSTSDGKRLLLRVPLKDGTACALPVGAYVKGYAKSHKSPRKCELVGKDAQGNLLAWEISRGAGTDLLTRGAAEPYVGFVAAGQRGVPDEAYPESPRLRSNVYYPNADPRSETAHAYKVRIGAKLRT